MTRGNSSINKISYFSSNSTIFFYNVSCKTIHKRVLFKVIKNNHYDGKTAKMSRFSFNNLETFPERWDLLLFFLSYWWYLHNISAFDYSINNIEDFSSKNLLSCPITTTLFLPQGTLSMIRLINLENAQSSVGCRHNQRK